MMMKTNDEKQHRLMIIGSLDEFVELVLQAKKRGIYTIVCDGYLNGPAKRVADQAYDIDVRDVDYIAQVCIDEQVDGIIGSFSDLLLEQITQIATKAGLRWYLKPERLPYYREKDKMKELLEELGIRVPKNRKISVNFKDEELEEFRFPLVIKPVNGYGSKGIYVVHSVREIRDRFNDVVIRSSGTHENILVEEYSLGREYNMMTWMVDGKIYPISLGDREKNPQRGSELPLVTRVAYPAKAATKIIDEAVDVLQKFAGVNNQTEGALSMQFFYNENGVEVCEIAGRLFGYEHELVTYCSGLNIEKLLLDYVYDTDSARRALQNHTILYPKHGAGLYFVGSQGAKIADISCCDRLGAEANVFEYKSFYQTGDVIDNYGSRPYLARYYLGADTREQLDAVTKHFYRDMYVPAVGGGRVDREFIFQSDD